MNQQTIHHTSQLLPESIRDHFPILNRKMNGQPMVFLDSAASSQKPICVINAIDRYYQNQHANIHRGVYELSQEATESFELARTEIAKYIGAAHDREIIFTKGTTESINLVASSFGSLIFKPGNTILLSAMEHHSNIVPWQLIAAKTEATIEVVRLLSDGSIDMADFEAKLKSNTAIVAITHVSNALGTINPIKEIISKAHKFDIPVLIDGAQALPHMKIDVSDLDADFYAFSSHKAYGPTGIGVLYGKEKWLDMMPPYQGGGEMISSVSFEKTTYNELPFKFEAGTPHIAGAIGLMEAIRFMDSIGIEKIKEHEHYLLKYAEKKLAEVPDIKFIGTAKEKAGVVSFLLGNAHPYDVGTLLDKMGIAVRTGHHCTEPLMNYLGIPGTVRASFGMYNFPEEIDALQQALFKIHKMLF
jgi:cysteine desulfurase / selenocysteine lyase